MARPTEINFTGLFIPNMLGTFRVIRGFAPLRDLARVSVPFGMTESGDGRVAGHQRELDERHAEDIQQYLEGQSERFLPEVILSVRFGMAFADNNGNQASVYLTGNDEDRAAMEGITAKRLLKPSATPRPYDVMQLSVKEDMLLQIQERRIIRRVDGNHRLEKALSLQDDPASANRYVAPFCMVLLFAPEYEPHDYTEALIFHTINSTAIPLHSEHALKLILGQDPGNAVSAEQEYHLNPALHLTRLLRDQALRSSQPVQQRLGTQPLTSFNQVARSMTELTPAQFENAEEQRQFAGNLFSGISEIVIKLEDSQPTLCKAMFFLDLAARVWQQTQADEEDHATHLAKAVDFLTGLGAWLGQGGFEELEEGGTLSAQILAIYEKVRRRLPKNIFMVRWYGMNAAAEERTRVDLRFAQVNRAVDDLERLDHIHLHIEDLATNEGGTYLIHPKMYDALASSDIVIVDLTRASANVHIEAGFALGKGKQDRMIFLFQQDDEFPTVPFDLNSYRYVPFKDAAQIPDLIKPHIKAIMRKAGMNLP